MSIKCVDNVLTKLFDVFEILLTIAWRTIWKLIVVVSRGNQRSSEIFFNKGWRSVWTSSAGATSTFFGPSRLLTIVFNENESSGVFWKIISNSFWILSIRSTYVNNWHEIENMFDLIDIINISYEFNSIDCFQTKHIILRKNTNFFIWFQLYFVHTDEHLIAYSRRRTIISFRSIINCAIVRTVQISNWSLFSVAKWSRRISRIWLTNIGSRP